LEAQSKAWTYGPNGLLSISLALAFEGDDRNGDKLGSDWCMFAIHSARTFKSPLLNKLSFAQVAAWECHA
jgi:hypothetical protein